MDANFFTQLPPAKLAGLIMTLVGMSLTAFTTWRYHRLYRRKRQIIYAADSRSSLMDRVCLVLLYLFIFGYGVGFADNFTRDVEPIYTFVIFIFFFGSIFVHAMVESQIAYIALLNNKNRELMKTFVNAIDMKDAYTKGHSQHVYEIIDLFYEELSEDHKKSISKPKLLDAALLHDCGKLGIKDELLNKVGLLNEEDWAIIKTHPERGKAMLDDTGYREISDWVLYHHERMDGRGYYCLPGSEIPLEARILTIADTYSALSTDRVYRTKVSHDHAIDIMLASVGTQLDGTLMECFLRIAREDLEALLRRR